MRNGRPTGRHLRISSFASQARVLAVPLARGPNSNPCPLSRNSPPISNCTRTCTFFVHCTCTFFSHLLRPTPPRPSRAPLPLPFTLPARPFRTPFPSSLPPPLLALANLRTRRSGPHPLHHYSTTRTSPRCRVALSHPPLLSPIRSDDRSDTPLYSSSSTNREPPRLRSMVSLPQTCRFRLGTRPGRVGRGRAGASVERGASAPAAARCARKTAAMAP